jgi:hypothetical protein
MDSAAHGARRVRRAPRADGCAGGRGHRHHHDHRRRAHTVNDNTDDHITLVHLTLLVDVLPTTTTTTPSTKTTTPPAEPAPDRHAVDRRHTVDRARLPRGPRDQRHRVPPGVSIGYAECETGQPGASGCDLTTAHVTTSERDRRVLRDDHRSPLRAQRVSGMVDCADAPGTCSVGAGTLDGTQGTDTPLTFDPNAPIPPPPTIIADPDTDLGLVTSVHVTGSGFHPNSPTIVRTCRRGSTDPQDCSTNASGFATFRRRRQPRHNRGGSARDPDPERDPRRLPRLPGL